jgi:S1-C subfamily serine protease
LVETDIISVKASYQSSLVYASDSDKVEVGDLVKTMVSIAGKVSDTVTQPAGVGTAATTVCGLA